MSGEAMNVSELDDGTSELSSSDTLTLALAYNSGTTHSTCVLSTRTADTDTSEPNWHAMSTSGKGKPVTVSMVPPWYGAVVGESEVSVGGVRYVKVSSEVGVSAGRINTPTCTRSAVGQVGVVNVMDEELRLTTAMRAEVAVEVELSETYNVEGEDAGINRFAPRTVTTIPPASDPVDGVMDTKAGDGTYCTGLLARDRTLLPNCTSTVTGIDALTSVDAAGKVHVIAEVLMADARITICWLNTQYVDSAGDVANSDEPVTVNTATDDQSTTDGDMDITTGAGRKVKVDAAGVR